MCGRYTLTITDIAALARAWGAEVEAALAAGWRPRFNVAPGDPMPLLCGPAGARRLQAARFGWENPRGGLLINARSETAGDRPTFREALAHQRAAVPVDGFFEWEGPPSARRPSWFHRGAAEPFLLAALSRTTPGGATAFAILTTAAVAPVARLHDRMPVILAPGQLEAWLADGPAPALPAPLPGWLAARPVSARANSVANDDAALLETRPEAAPPRVEQVRLW